MAQTVEQILIQMLGTQALRIAQLEAAIGAERERIAELQKQVQTPQPSP